MTTADSNPRDLASRMSGAVVSLCSDLDISRHVFRDGPSYVIRDSTSFSTHRLSPHEYAIISALDDSETLGACFERLTGDGILDEEDEEAYYSFILDLHQRGLLSLPVNDAERLFQRYQYRQRLRFRAQITGVLFLRVPLFNPDRLLNHTIGLFRWMFTAPAFVLWLLLICSAAVVALSRFHALTMPILTMVSGANIILLWCTLIGLKVVHEFGHAYACKAFGGHVPEMGAFFILFTPCAYVDASDSWRFSSVRQRATVTLGGLYFESIVGAIAVFVWAFTPPSAINTIAHQVIILATVVTLGFNLNPLMRYDAYYLVSDLWGVPNLRARVQAVLKRWAKRFMFGVHEPADPDQSRGFQVSLGAFGVAQLTYRTLLLISIATVLVLRFGLIGLVLSSLFLGMLVAKAVLDLCRYVLSAEEMQGRRWRGVFALLCCLSAATWALGFVPVRSPIRTVGVATMEEVANLRATSSGFVKSIPIQVGRHVEPGELLVEVVDDELADEARAAQWRRDFVHDKLLESLGSGAADAAMHAAELERETARLEQFTQRLEDLDALSPINGIVTEIVPTAPGAYVGQGDLLATVKGGHRQVICLIGQERLQLLDVAIGDRVSVRCVGDPTRDVTATVVHIDDEGSHLVRHKPLRAEFGGPIPIDPTTGQASEPVFEVRLAIPQSAPVFDGGLVRVQLPARARTLSQITHHRVSLFFNRLREEGATQ